MSSYIVRNSALDLARCSRTNRGLITQNVCPARDVAVDFGFAIQFSYWFDYLQRGVVKDLSRVVVPSFIQHSATPAVGAILRGTFRQLVLSPAPCCRYLRFSRVLLGDLHVQGAEVLWTESACLPFSNASAIETASSSSAIALSISCARTKAPARSWRAISRGDSRPSSSARFFACPRYLMASRLRTARGIWAYIKRRCAQCEDCE